MTFISIVNGHTLDTSFLHNLSYGIIFANVVILIGHLSHSVHLYISTTFALSMAVLFASMAKGPGTMTVMALISTSNRLSKKKHSKYLLAHMCARLALLYEPNNTDLFLMDRQSSSHVNSRITPHEEDN